MYILICKDEAIVVDPHKNEDLLDLLKRFFIKKVKIILTHEHSDHISGIWWFLENFYCTLICSENCAKSISCIKNSRPLFLMRAIADEDIKNGTKKLKKFKEEYILKSYKADITFSDFFQYDWQGHNLFLKAIPGHSVGSSLIILDGKYAFTGDSLLKDYPVIVSFPNSDRMAFLEKTIKIFENELTPDMTIFPGHGKPFVLSELMNGNKIHVNTR